MKTAQIAVDHNNPIATGANLADALIPVVFGVATSFDERQQQVLVIGGFVSALAGAASAAVGRDVAAALFSMVAEQLRNITEEQLEANAQQVPS